MDTKTRREIWLLLNRANELSEQVDRSVTGADVDLVSGLQSLSSMWAMRMLELKDRAEAAPAPQAGPAGECPAARQIAELVANHSNTLMFCRGMMNPSCDPVIIRGRYTDWLSGEADRFIRGAQ
jgi:hypothetical protein